MTQGGIIEGNMYLAAAIVAICNALTALAVVLLVRRWVRHEVSRFRDHAQGELLKLVNGEPCQLGSIANAFGRQIGSEAGRSAKASLLADLSHMKRDAALDATDAAAGAIGQKNPGIGALLSSLGPRSRKGLLSNPIAQLALQGLMGMGGPGPGPGAGNGGGASEYTGRKHRE